MPPRKKTTGPTPIDAVKHPADTRKNIPTAELRDFVADEENNPVTVRYPRNPDLDPQLVWKGKDEQDSADLEVTAPPIYIQHGRLDLASFCEAQQIRHCGSPVHLVL